MPNPNQCIYFEKPDVCRMPVNGKCGYKDGHVCKSKGDLEQNNKTNERYKGRKKAPNYYRKEFDL